MPIRLLCDNPPPAGTISRQESLSTSYPQDLRPAPSRPPTQLRASALTLDLWSRCPPSLSAPPFAADEAQTNTETSYPPRPTTRRPRKSGPLSDPDAVIRDVLRDGACVEARARSSGMGGSLVGGVGVALRGDRPAWTISHRWPTQRGNRTTTRLLLPDQSLVGCDVRGRPQVVLQEKVAVDEVGAPMETDWFSRAFGKGCATRRRCCSPHRRLVHCRQSPRSASQR